jgi:hypothetical protein
MIVMIVCDQDEIGLGSALELPRVDIDDQPVSFYPKAVVSQPMDI